MTAIDASIQLATTAAQAADDKLGEDIIVLDVSAQLSITDCFVLVTGDNERQVDAIVDEVEARLAEAGRKPVRREGAHENRWVLLDYSDIVVHVQRRAEREFYALDRLWADCPVIEVAGIEPSARLVGGDEVDPFTVADQEELPLAGQEPDAEEL